MFSTLFADFFDFVGAMWRAPGPLGPGYKYPPVPLGIGYKAVAAAISHLLRLQACLAGERLNSSGFLSENEKIYMLLVNVVEVAVEAPSA